MDRSSERHSPDLASLSPKEWLLLSTRAEMLCVERLSSLASRLASNDEALAETLAKMADDERAHLDALSRFDADVPWPQLLKVNERALALLLAVHLPTLCRGPHSEDSDSVKTFVEHVERESIDFYRVLAARAETPELAAFFERMARAEEAHAGNVRDAKD
jgi:rubrerythrin